MKSNIAHLPHRSLRYFESGEGRTVLLVHAFPLSADQWLPQVHRVPPGWRFIAPDLRGFRGVGPAFEDPSLVNLSIDDYANDMITLMAHLDIDRAVVCGLSMGGYVAFAMMRRAPAKVAGLVLSNTRAGSDSEQGRAGRDKMIDLVQRHGPARVADELLPKLLGATTHAQQPDLADAVRRLILVNSAEGIAVALGALRTRPDSTPLLSTISIPALIITSDEDAIIPVTEAEVMHTGIRGSSMVVLPNVGHLANLEDPMGWGKALERFLTSLP